MDQRTVPREQRAHDLLVGLRNGELLVLEDHHQQSQEVARVNEAGVGRDGRRQVRRPEDEDPLRGVFGSWELFLYEV